MSGAIFKPKPYKHWSQRSRKYILTLSCSEGKLKAAVLQHILKSLVTIFFKISLQIYIIVVRNNKPTFFHIFALKTDNSLSAIGIFLLYITATA